MVRRGAEHGVDVESGGGAEIDAAAIAHVNILSGLSRSSEGLRWRFSDANLGKFA